MKTFGIPSLARFFFPEPEIPAAEPIAPPANRPAARTTNSVECEFCGCTLDADGLVLRRGDAAKRMLAHEETIADLRRKLDAANEKIAALTPAANPERRGLDLRVFKERQ